MKHIVIIGYGQLGAEVCQRHLDLGDMVSSVSRTPHPNLTATHHHRTVDLDQLTQAIDLPDSIDTLYYFAPPSDKDLTDRRLKQFLALHQHLNISHIVYISTSGVYGNSNGDWITEETAVNPTVDRAKRRLDAETQLLSFNKQSSTAVSILRCAAIYSAKSVNLQRIKANKKPVIKKEQAPFTNRIHLHDLTEVCVRISQHRPLRYEIYNVSDGQPTTTTEHAWLLSDLAGVVRNLEIDLSKASQYYSPAYMSYLNESKRLDISKLKNKIKPVLKYQDCAEGIKACLGEEL